MKATKKLKRIRKLLIKSTAAASVLCTSLIQMPYAVLAKSNVLETNALSEIQAFTDESGNSFNSGVQEFDVENGSTQMSESEAFRIYRPVLEAAQWIINNRDNEEISTAPYFNELYGVYISHLDFGTNTLDEYGYTIQDFSGDGIPELAITTLYESQWKKSFQPILALFTLKDGQPMPVLHSIARSWSIYAGNNIFIDFEEGSLWDEGIGRFSFDKDCQSKKRIDCYFTVAKDPDLSTSDRITYYNTTGVHDREASTFLGGLDIYQEHYQEIYEQRQLLDTKPLTDLSTPENTYQLSAKVEGNGKTVLINEPFRIQAALSHNGKHVSDWTDYSFTYEKIGQVTLNQSWNIDNAIIFEVIPNQTGLLKLTIGDKGSGASIDIELQVTDKRTQYSYPLYKLRDVFYPNVFGDTQTPTNFYDLNGLYINQYQYTENTVNGKKVNNVSFDVYNSNYSYGSVDVYDQNGKLIKITEINPRRGMTSLFELPSTVCNMAADAVNAKTMSYTASTYSEKTSINIDVPEGGYFTVSNNVFNSPGAMVFNSVDAMVFGANKVISHITADKTKTKTTLFDLFKMTDIQFMQKYPSQAASLAIKKNILEEVQKSHERIAKGCAKRLVKESAKAGSKLSFGLVVDMGDALINTLGLNWQTLLGVVTGIGEAAFMKLLGPAGVALSAGFTLQGWADEACLAMEVFQSLDEPYLKVFSSRQFTDVGTGIEVYPDSDAPLPSDAILQVYKIYDEDIFSLDPEQYDLFNISLIKDEKEVQPSSKVRVAMDIPSNYDPKNTKLYRQEQDGSWTLIHTDVDYEKRKLYFTTTHFSLYLLTEEKLAASDPDSDLSTPTKPSKPSVKTSDMHRLYNPNSGEHFYAKEAGEKAYLVSLGWKDEGIGWTAPVESKTPVYRLYNPNAGDHHYTLNPAEKNMLVSVGWKDEGIGWYSDDAKGKPLYRQYNPNAKAGSHNYTLNKAENDYLAGIGWKAEGIAWYAVN